jgi:hypothetical protein
MAVPKNKGLLSKCKTKLKSPDTLTPSTPAKDRRYTESTKRCLVKNLECGNLNAARRNALDLRMPDVAMRLLQIKQQITRLLDDLGEP